MGSRFIVILSLFFVVGGLERLAKAERPGEAVSADDDAGDPPSAEAAAFGEAVRKVAPKSKASGSAKGVLGSARMRKANRVAAEMVKKRLKSRGNGSDLKLMAKAGSADVVIVAGEYDRAQDALRAMDIKFVVIRPRHVAKLDLMAFAKLGGDFVLAHHRTRHNGHSL